MKTKILATILLTTLLTGCQSQFIKDLVKIHPYGKKEVKTTMEDIYDLAEPPKNFDKVCQSAGMVQGKFYCNNREMMCQKPKVGEMKCYVEKQETKDQRAKEEREYYLSGKAGRREEFYFYEEKYKNTKAPRDIDSLIKYGRAIECKKDTSTQTPLLCSKKN